MIQNISYHKHRVQVTVEGAGKPVLLLHGWPTNARLWQAQCAFLKSHFQLIIPDWLGFGQSAKPDDHVYSFQRMKEVLDEIVIQLKIKEKLTIVAHDIGGPAAILWADEHQKKLSRLVLLNTVLYDWQTPMDKLGHFIFGLPGINRLQMSNPGLKQLMLNLLKNRKSANRMAIREILQHHAPWPHQVRLKAIMEPVNKEGRALLSNLATTLNNLTVDKYLVVAKQDPLCYRHMQKFLEQYPETPAFTLEKCGHFIPIDQPEALNQMLAQLLNLPEEKGQTLSDTA